MNRDTLIAIDGLRVNARTRTILQVEHLRVHAGEVVGVLGPNGAGKSTLLRTCAGFQRPSAGSVNVLGQRVESLGFLGMAALRRRIGYVPQTIPPAGEMPVTVREIVAIGRSGIRGLLRPLHAADWRCVDAWIDRLDLDDVAGRPYSEISGGQQRKVLIARAMVQEPRLLLLDEPAAHLDLGAREQIVQTLQRLHEEMDLTVVLVCHEVEVLPPSCSRVILLDGGAVWADGRPEAVLTDDRVHSLYGPGLCVLHCDGRHAVVPAMGGMA